MSRGQPNKPGCLTTGQLVEVMTSQKSDLSTTESKEVSRADGMENLSVIAVREPREESREVALVAILPFYAGDEFVVLYLPRPRAVLEIGDL